jgi:hypothetical protein
MLEEIIEFVRGLTARYYRNLAVALHCRAWLSFAFQHSCDRALVDTLRLYPHVKRAVPRRPSTVDLCLVKIVLEIEECSLRHTGAGLVWKHAGSFCTYSAARSEYFFCIPS